MIFATIDAALKDLQQGKFIIVTDNENRENEGDFVIAADKITPEAINFMAHHGRGVICLAMSGEQLDRLQIPLMTQENSSNQGTAFTLSIEAANGVTTGVSAAERAHTIKVAIDKNSTPADIVKPGHIFPLRAQDKGVLVRAGHTEAGVDLTRLAGLQPGAVICEIMNQDGSMARVDDLKVIAQEHDIKMIHIDDLITYRMRHEIHIQKMSQSTIPVKDLGVFDITIYHSMIDGTEISVLSKGDLSQTPVVRVHSSCLTGDIFGSIRCDCGEQLQLAMKKISTEGGIIIYLPQEGRGIGLVNKIKAYALQDTGFDTVEANLKLGFAADQRDYALAAQVLKFMNINEIRLLTNNPKKIEQLKYYGISKIHREPLITDGHHENCGYLKTKAKKLNHMMELEEVSS